MVNNKSISEETIRTQLETGILAKLKDIINKFNQDGKTNEDDTYSLWKIMDEESKIFASKLKKKITYLECYNNIFLPPLEIKIDISLDAISLESLSMGQRAIVLLKIILAYDDKPLIIDQPEEDLDNRYIYEQLVPAFREAKKKRQIIIATHNANLTVNTDAEQVIIAKYDKGNIYYEPGSLETPSTKHDIKQILEGGDDAFEKREEKYGYKF